MKCFFNQYKDLLPADLKITNIMENWDKILVKHFAVMKYVDIVGCILPHEPTLNAWSSEGKNITRPLDHAYSKCHE